MIAGSTNRRLFDKGRTQKINELSDEEVIIEEQEDGIEQ